MPTLVFIPGFSRNQQDYQKLRSTIPKNYELYFVEHSDLFIDVAYSSTIGINNFLRKNNLSNVILAGHSLGGAIAIDFAAKHPNKVNKLVLIDSVGIAGDESFLARARNVLLEHRLGAIARNMRALWIVAHNPKMHLALAKFVHWAIFENQARDLKVHTIIVWGEKDRIMALWKGKKLNRLIVKSELIILKDVGHDWVLHDGHKFWDYLEKFHAGAV